MSKRKLSFDRLQEDKVPVFPKSVVPATFGINHQFYSKHEIDNYLKLLVGSMRKDICRFETYIDEAGGGNNTPDDVRGFYNVIDLLTKYLVMLEPSVNSSNTVEKTRK